MDSKIRKSRSLLALSTFEKAALETAALHSCSVYDRMAECLGQETGSPVRRLFPECSLDRTKRIRPTAHSPDLLYLLKQPASTQRIQFSFELFHQQWLSF